MELNKPFSLPAVFGAETSAAEDQNHRDLALQFGELPSLSGVVGKFIVVEDSPRNNVRSHIKSSNCRMRLTCLFTCQPSVASFYSVAANMTAPGTLNEIKLSGRLRFIVD
jgi:hypothetical protein